MKFIVAAVALCLSVHVLGQRGHWDKERAFTHQFTLKASERHMVKTTRLPEGTTELVFRMTVLDDNQHLSNNLVSLLKSIPDPTAISQGSAAGVFLISKIAGNDKNRFSVFTSLEPAQKFKEDGKPGQACYAQATSVNKEVRLLSYPSVCAQAEVLYFVFESANRFLSQNVVLEVVPWVDATEARGWKPNHKQSVLDLCETSALAQLMTHPDDLCLCILNHISSQHSWPEFQRLLTAEKSKLYRDMGNRCLSAQTGDKSLQQAMRAQVALHFEQQRYDKAIKLLESGVFAHGAATAADQLQMARLLVFSRQYERAKPYLETAQRLGADILQTQLLQAHLHLLEGDFQKSRTLHRRFKSQYISVNQTWKDQTLSDLSRLEAEGHEADYKRILNVLTDD